MFDLWQLITGQKTLPQDKVQRLYVLGIRECPLVGRLRLLTLIPTTAMLLDALTKAMVSPQLLRLLMCGKVDFHNVPDHPVKTRTLPTLPIEEESDLLLTDEEVMNMAELKPNKVMMSTASSLLGLIAGATSKKLMVASTVAAMATAADAQSTGGNNADDGDHGGHFSLYMTLFLTVIIAIIVEKHISGFFKKPQMEHFMVPKVEQIRQPAPKRYREGDEEMDAMAQPVDMDVDESEEMTPRSPRTVRLFYERVKKMHEDYVKLAEEKIQAKDDEAWNAYNDSEYYKSQIDEEKEMLKDMTTNRDVFRQDCRMWHDKYDEKAEQYAELEAKFQDELQKFQVAQHERDEAVRMRHDIEGQMKRADRDKDKAIADFKDMQIRWQTQLAESRKLEAEKNEWKKNYEELAAERQKEKDAAQRNKFSDPQELAASGKRLKEGLNMSIAELEALNIKLTNDNECYHKANRELMNELALAKAPAEVLISPHGTCYHALGCGHSPGGSKKFRKCKDCLP